MARDFAKMLTRIWRDPEWLDLGTAEQSVYVALLTTDDLSWCGVAPLLPQRYAGFASDLTLPKVKKAFAGLTDRRFIIPDETTGEVAVRSFLRNDKVMSQPNIVRAMYKALGLVRSELILSNLHDEMRRSYAEAPDYAGWDTLKSLDPELMASVKGSAKGSAKGPLMSLGRAS